MPTNSNQNQSRNQHIHRERSMSLSTLTGSNNIGLFTLYFPNIFTPTFFQQCFKNVYEFSSIFDHYELNIIYIYHVRIQSYGNCVNVSCKYLIFSVVRYKHFVDR